jgi:energy-coupling factor transport system ATP-binding protein
MTVFQDKSILLYDEPTFGQDRESILIIHRMIVLLKKMGKIQIIISHDEQFIQSLGAKVYDLDNGTLLRNS